MSHKIHLPCGRIVLIDECDTHLIEGWAIWGSRRQNGDPSYIVCSRTVDGKKERTPLSRLLTGAPKGTVVDHKNGDLDDNRRSANLRVCTHSNNSQNRRVGRNNSTGFKGVTRYEGRFRAVIMVGKRQRSLGGYCDPIAAAVAYDRAAKAHFGEFARLNFGPDRDWLLPYPAAPIRRSPTNRRS